MSEYLQLLQEFKDLLQVKAWIDHAITSSAAAPEQPFAIQKIRLNRRAEVIHRLAIIKHQLIMRHVDLCATKGVFNDMGYPSDIKDFKLHIPLPQTS